MTPIIFTGPPDIEHGGNLPPHRVVAPHTLYSLRETAEGEGIVGAALVVVRPDPDLEGKIVVYSVLHTSDDVEAWIGAGWRITSY